MEAEGTTNTKLYGINVAKYSVPDSAASGSYGVSGIDSVGDAIGFFNIQKDTSFKICYSCGNAGGGTLGLYIKGIKNQDVTFLPTGGWTGTNHYFTKVISNLTILWGSTIRLQYDSTLTGKGVNIDYISVP